MNALPTKRPSADPTPLHDDEETVYSVLRSVTRFGPWEPPETMRLVSVMGHIALDYQEADLPLGVTEVECQVFMGSVEITVPDDVDVELTGSVFMGSVETTGGNGRGRWRRRAREFLLGEGPDERDEKVERPLLSVHCSGAMGSVDVKLR
jgi:hypothetical protein